LYLKMRYSPDKPNVLQKPQGQTFQPYANGVGLAYLAFAPAERMASLKAAYPFFEFGAHLWKTQANLETYLADVREQGCAIVPFDRNAALRVSVPVFNKAGALVAVLGCSTPMQGLDDEEQKRIVNLTLEMARGIKNGSLDAADFRELFLRGLKNMLRYIGVDAGTGEKNE
jgi:DNA-binding IclR family transcriptional regulator